jgi:hypothetical protein
MRLMTFNWRLITPAASRGGWGAACNVRQVYLAAPTGLYEVFESFQTQGTAMHGGVDLPIRLGIWILVALATLAIPAAEGVLEADLVNPHCDAPPWQDVFVSRLALFALHLHLMIFIVLRDSLVNLAFPTQAARNFGS